MKIDNDKKYLRVGSHQVESFHGNTTDFLRTLERIKNEAVKLARKLL